MVPIYTQVVGSGGAGTISFNNIPNNYADLRIVASTRSSATGALEGLYLFINGDSGSNYSTTAIYGSGSSGIGSYRASNQGVGAIGTGDTAGNTTNTFSTVEIYIPNYTLSSFKQIISDSVAENNTTGGATLRMFSTLWRNTAAINSIRLQNDSGGTFVQNTTITLYGIKTS